MASRTKIRTVGHGTASADTFADLVSGIGVGKVVDVRRFPGSRRHPHFSQDEMPRWLAESGISYQWLEALGGRRRSENGSRNVALVNPQFRAYADHMATDEFAEGVRVLLELATSSEVAVMCSESVWWRCHRRLLADHLDLVEGVEVEHVFPGGRLSVHPVTAGARRSGDVVVYDRRSSGRSSIGE